MKPRKLVMTCTFVALVAENQAHSMNFTVDPQASSLTVQVQLPLGSRMDSSPLSGSLSMPLQWGPSLDPLAITVQDFHLTANEPFSFNFGLFTVGGTGIGLRYAQPGTPYGPSPVLGGAFQFLGVPTIVDGILSNGSNLSDLGTQSSDIDGAITIVGDTVTLSYSQSGVIEDIDVGFGFADIVITGTVVAHAALPEVPAVSTYALAALMLGFAIIGTLLLRSRATLLSTGVDVP